jgi:hypothetical protein
MAQDLLLLRPDAIVTSESGYLMVDYDRIDVKMMTFQAYRDSPSSSQGMAQLDLGRILIDRLSSGASGSLQRLCRENPSAQGTSAASVDPLNV